MRKIFVVFAVSLSLFACARPSFSPAQQYADDIRHLIVTNDREGLSRLEYSSGARMDEYQLDCVLDNAAGVKPIRTFLKRPGIETKLYGPFPLADDDRGNVYHVLYYDPKVVRLDVLLLRYRAYSEALVDLWGTGYVTTMIIEADERVHLYGNPFWAETHIPGARMDF